MSSHSDSIQAAAAWWSMWAAWVQAGGAILAMVVTIILARGSAKREAAAEKAAEERIQRAEAAAEARAAAADKAADQRAKAAEDRADKRRTQEIDSQSKRPIEVVLPFIESAIEWIKKEADRYGKLPDDGVHFYVINGPPCVEAAERAEAALSAPIRPIDAKDLAEIKRLLGNQASPSPAPPSQVAPRLAAHAETIDALKEKLKKSLAKRPRRSRAST